MPTTPTINQLQNTAGYNTQGGRYIAAFPIFLLGGAAMPAGVTIGPVWELGDRRQIDITLQTSAMSGTSPTLDVAIQSSPNGMDDWQTLDSFAQKSGVGLTMGAVTPQGTTPPTITLTGTQAKPVKLVVQCTLGGARGTWAGQYSIDGGTSWVAFTSAATVPVIDANGTDTGIVINIATDHSASTDNLWQAFTIGYERKSFVGLANFVRAVATVRGSGTPTFTAALTGVALN